MPAEADSETPRLRGSHPHIQVQTHYCMPAGAHRQVERERRHAERGGQREDDAEEQKGAQEVALRGRATPLMQRPGGVTDTATRSWRLCAVQQERRLITTPSASACYLTACLPPLLLQAAWVLRKLCITGSAPWHGLAGVSAQQQKSRTTAGQVFGAGDCMGRAP